MIFARNLAAHAYGLNHGIALEGVAVQRLSELRFLGRKGLNDTVDIHGRGGSGSRGGSGGRALRLLRHGRWHTRGDGDKKRRQCKTVEGKSLHMSVILYG